MSKTLEERLLAVKQDLAQVSSCLGRHPGSLSVGIETQAREFADSGRGIDHAVDMIHARAASRLYLTDLTRDGAADHNDSVVYGTQRVRFAHARLLGLQAYLATNWALADRLTGMAGHILCTQEAGRNLAKPAKLVEHLINDQKCTKTVAAVQGSTQNMFGWPIGLSYALRNYFVHGGSEYDDFGFFSGSDARSAFTVAADGWQRVVKKARDYGVNEAQARLPPGNLDTAPDDLRAVLDMCEREVDDALGILVSTASKAMLFHIGYLLGED